MGGASSESISPDALRRLAGKFVVFDGPDGCGKSTQLAMARGSLSAAGLRVVEARDPGGTEIGDRIRKVLLGYDLSAMDVRCETLLFMASRAQLVSEVVEPALAEGAAVLCSRFISATYAYQGAAGFDIGDIMQLGSWAVGDCWPDVTVVFDVPVEVGFERTGRRAHHAGSRRSGGDGDQGELFVDATVDAMEARPIDFHRGVRDVFLRLPEIYPKPVRIVDGVGEVADVHLRVMEALVSVIG
jgi:dTMP kinase